MKTKDYKIESGEAEDAEAIYELYWAVAAFEGGLARTAEEITPEYVEYFSHPIEQNETLSKGFAIVHNTDKRGRIGIAASGGANRNQAGRTGILLYLRFKIKEAESYPIGKAIRLTFTKKPVFEDENGSDIF
jgi:hypothetical protein